MNVTWFLWHDDRRYFNVGQTAICLLKLRGDQWLLTTIKKITRLLDVTDGVGYDAVEVKEYEQYFGRLVVEYHNPCRTMGRKYENVMDELEVVQILNEQYTGNEFPGYENVRLSYPLLKNIVDRQLPGLGRCPAKPEGCLPHHRHQDRKAVCGVGHVPDRDAAPAVVELRRRRPRREH